MKKWAIIILVLFCTFSSVVYAEKIYMPDGSQLETDGLSRQDITDAFNIARKAMKNKGSATDFIEDVDPQKLQDWVNLITSAIKQICNDLSITVNEFIKTPVGVWIAVLVTYKVMGADLLGNAVRFIVVVPLWTILTGIILFLGWYFFSYKTVYNIEYDDELEKKGKKKIARRISRYEWDPAKVSGYTPPKYVFGVTLLITEGVISVAALIILLAG